MICKTVCWRIGAEWLFQVSNYMWDESGEERSTAHAQAPTWLIVGRIVVPSNGTVKHLWLPVETSQLPPIWRPPKSAIWKLSPNHPTCKRNALQAVCQHLDIVGFGKSLLYPMSAISFCIYRSSQILLFSVPGIQTPWNASYMHANGFLTAFAIVSEDIRRNRKGAKWDDFEQEAWDTALGFEGADFGKCRETLHTP